MYHKLHPFQVYSSISFNGHCEMTTIKSAKHFHHSQKTLPAPLQSRPLSIPHLPPQATWAVWCSGRMLNT